MMCRSDCDLYKLLPESEARDDAIKLSAGHCIEVNLIASINVDNKRFLEGDVSVPRNEYLAPC